jgi:hypothetical protein
MDCDFIVATPDVLSEQARRRRGPELDLSQYHCPISGVSFICRSKEATMRKLGINGAKPRSPAEWVLSRIRQHRMTETGQESQDFEAMLHWQDPVERLRTIRRQHTHTLVDDNPASG